jgi:hypothetical protein
MIHTVDVAQGHKNRGIRTFFLIPSAVPEHDHLGAQPCPLIDQIVGDCTRCGGGRVAES